MGSETVEDDELNREDDEYNRAVLLQARQRLETEHLNHNKTRTSSFTISLPVAAIKPEEETTPAKRVRLSFPPEKYSNLEHMSASYMAELQTPKLTYT